MIRVEGDPIDRGVTKPRKPAVTKPAKGKRNAGGRPRVHASKAEKQRAYRARKGNTKRAAFRGEAIAQFESPVDLGVKR